MKNKIKLFRQKVGFSQQKLAIHCEVSRQTINAIENDKYDPTLELAFRLAKTLHSSVDELFLFDVNHQKANVL